MMPTDIVPASPVDVPSNVLILLARHLGFTTACHMQGHLVGSLGYHAWRNLHFFDVHVADSLLKIHAGD
jgi:hypothetical protein